MFREGVILEWRSPDGVEDNRVTVWEQDTVRWPGDTSTERRIDRRISVTDMQEEDGGFYTCQAKSSSAESPLQGENITVVLEDHLVVDFRSD